ncbi:MAG: hypothetical protein CM15mP120_26980 [Pseudomonadota bacterium]|nr:MAG: hypothetical protein CM15mP120_26980 [Pseudomonadota bacterium]
MTIGVERKCRHCHLSCRYLRSRCARTAAVHAERALYNQWLSFIQMELDAHTYTSCVSTKTLRTYTANAPAAIETAIEGFKKASGCGNCTPARPNIFVGRSLHRRRHPADFCADLGGKLRLYVGPCITAVYGKTDRTIRLQTRCEIEL